MSGEEYTYISHSKNDQGVVNTLKSHLEGVANRAALYADEFGASTEARLAGLYHDLGKYGQLFQRRLEGKERGIDHWSAGAWAVLTEYKELGIASALAIQGHHLGLQKASRHSLQDMSLDRLSAKHPLNLRLSETDPNLKILLERMARDGMSMPQDSFNSIYDYSKHLEMSAAAMLDVRMLYSALVDADFIETEAHFQAKSAECKSYRKSGPALDPSKAYSILELYLKDIKKASQASDHINRLRSDLLNTCLDKSSTSPGLFTLTAPTGSGKTLSMLAFALKHAMKNGFRRIVFVIPYLSIIEQTVEVYQSIFKDHFDDNYILENHSMAGIHDDNGNSGEGDYYQKNLLAENWDAPIVVTTSVQLLESLFSNRPSTCRKLHRLAGSIILFDEVQTLPVRLIIPTLATLSRLAERFHSSIVFSTATQPAFRNLNEHVRGFCNNGWQSQEIVPENLRLFDRAKRTEINWPDLDQRISWDDLAKQISKTDQVLCIVNLKRHANELYDSLEKHEAEGLLHLSTNMCSRHRVETLKKVHDRLKTGEPCRLVSTQCIEAGVDVDFPVVFRALGPMDSIAQAAGRCNRNGHMETGNVNVFIPDDNRLYPSGAYGQADSITRSILKDDGDILPDINDPQIFRRYYENLYSVNRPGEQSEELIEAIKAQDFVDVSKRYRLIDQVTINVLVPYDNDIYQLLSDEVRAHGLSRSWIAKARQYTISLFKPKYDDPVFAYLEPILHRDRSKSDDWYIYLNANHYHPDKGLVAPARSNCIIA